MKNIGKMNKVKAKMIKIKILGINKINKMIIINPMRHKSILQAKTILINMFNNYSLLMKTILIIKLKAKMEARET